MDVEKLLDIIIDVYINEKQLSSNLSDELIIQAIHSDSIDVRGWLAKALVFDDANKNVVALLCKLSEDDDSSVRVEAIDSLSSYRCPESYSALCLAINDSDELVRAYAAFGIAVVGKAISASEAKKLLSYAEEKEHSTRVLVGIYEGLYILGNDTALDKLIYLFQEDNYHTQCAVLNALEEIINSNNWHKIDAFISRLDTAQYPVSVSSTLLRLQKKCTDFA